MEKTLEDHLLEAVEGLGKEDWKKFKYKLKHYKLKPGYNHIPWMILEEAERLEVVEEMTDHFGTRYGVEIAVDVLNAINKRKHADDLSQALREGKSPQRTWGQGQIHGGNIGALDPSKV